MSFVGRETAESFWPEVSDHSSVSSALAAAAAEITAGSETKVVREQLPLATFLGSSFTSEPSIEFTNQSNSHQNTLNFRGRKRRKHQRSRKERLSSVHAVPAASEQVQDTDAYDSDTSTGSMKQPDVSVKATLLQEHSSKQGRR